MPVSYVTGNHSELTPHGPVTAEKRTQQADRALNCSDWVAYSHSVRTSAPALNWPARLGSRDNLSMVTVWPSTTTVRSAE